MNRVEAIHTTARRYCEEHFAFWSNKYAQGKWNEKEAKGVFPRYLVLKAILIDIERRTHDQFLAEADVVSHLLNVGRTAQYAMTQNLYDHSDHAAIQTMDDERSKFCAFMSSAIHKDLSQTEPMAYRRVLSGEESDCAWAELKERWSLTGGAWYPLSSTQGSKDMLAFHTDFFHALKRGPQTIRGLLSQMQTNRVFELREHDVDPDYEVDSSLMELCYTGAEGYWTSPAHAWLIYASHESSVTIAGRALVEPLKLAWPDRAARQYIGPFSTKDLRGTWKNQLHANLVEGN